MDDPVPNDVRLDLARGMLVLGSDMAGKSTYLRTVATHALLAQSIACVPAERYAAPILAVRTMMRVEDDVTERRSRFLAEAEAARDILLEPREDGIDRLCIIDEPFRGTNTADRVAASGAFLRALHRARVFVVAATARRRAREAARRLPYHFLESVGGSRLTFDERLRPGAAAPRNALAVLELVGFPHSVLEDARALAAAREP